MDSNNKLFTAPGPRFDLAFIIEDRRLYVNKTVLTLVSPVFEAMFQGDYIERSATEIPLPGKTYDEMLEFLHAIFPSTLKAVSENNFETLLSLADEYQVDTLKERCETFAVRETERGDIDKGKLVHHLALAEKHNWSALLETCIDKAKFYLLTGEGSLSRCDEFNDLSVETKYKITSLRMEFIEAQVTTNLKRNNIPQMNKLCIGIIGDSCYDEILIDGCQRCVRELEVMTRDFEQNLSNLLSNFKTD